MDRAASALITQTVDRDCVRRDRTPNGVAWRFPDWTAVGFAFPSPFLGSRSLCVPLPELLATCWARSAAYRGTLSPRFGRSLAATLTRIAMGGFCRQFSGGLVAGRRLSPCPHFLALHGLRVGKPDSVVRSIFQFRRSLSCPTTRGIYRTASGIRDFRISSIPVIHRLVQLLPGKAKWRCIRRWIR